MHHLWIVVLGTQGQPVSTAAISLFVRLSFFVLGRAVGLGGSYLAQRLLPPPKPRAVGLDLGTTYSCVGVFHAGRGEVEIMSDSAGHRIIPSVVTFFGAFYVLDFFWGLWLRPGLFSLSLSPPLFIFLSFFLSFSCSLLLSLAFLSLSFVKKQKPKD